MIRPKVTIDGNEAAARVARCHHEDGTRSALTLRATLLGTGEALAADEIEERGGRRQTLGYGQLTVQ